MAKKQTRRSISVSRTTYERLKQFCEANNVSMSQFVETRVGDFLGEGSGEQVHLERTERPAPAPMAPRPQPAPIGSIRSESTNTGRQSTVVGLPAIQPTVKPPQQTAPAAQPVPMTSAAARYAVEPPPPIIKPKQETAAPKPAEKRPDQIFTF